MGYLSGVDAESVEQSPGVQIPEADGEVHASGHQVVFVVAGVFPVGVQETVDAASVTRQDLVRGPV